MDIDIYIIIILNFDKSFYVTLLYDLHVKLHQKSVQEHESKYIRYNKY